jgi:glycosyltransferase involved in cell wall biosynthesis
VVDALRVRGHDVQVLAAAPRVPVSDPPHVHRRFKLIEEYCWYSTDAWFHPLGAKLRDAESRFINACNVHALISFLDGFDPDVVYVCNVIGLGGLGLMGCLQYLKLPWVWQLGDCVPNILCGFAEGMLPTLVEEFSRQISGHYIIVSSQLQQEIERRGVVLKGQVDVIPNWIVGERPAPRTVFYRAGQRLRIMSAGQVTRYKGVHYLIEAAAHLRDAGLTNFVVDIYGRIADPSFANLIRRLEVDEFVELKGVRPQKELMRLYGDYDVFAFPTQEREPFGLVPLEAVARGCVPVITRQCGIAEWLVHGVHCLKAERTAAAFADTFAEILQGRIALEPIARRGAVAAWRNFHIDTILPQIERKLKQASTQSRAGAGKASDAYRLARMAEQLTQALIQEARVA